MGRVTARRKIVRLHGGAVSERPDTLVVEEPLEIRVGGKPFWFRSRELTAVVRGM